MKKSKLTNSANSFHATTRKKRISKKKSVFGALAKYANPEFWKFEKDAWPNAAAEKHKKWLAENNS